jgi:DNA-binding MurR/RpiR family transcriptional regulator
MNNVSVADKVLATFENPVYNTFTTKQAAARFRVSPSTVLKAVKTLRLEGFPIYRNEKNFEGRKIAVYRLGSPSKSFKKALKAGNEKAILKSLG